MTSELKAKIAMLAALDPADYEARRREEAKSLGVRASWLDSAVRRARRELGFEDSGGECSGLQGEEFCFTDPEPWPEPVDGAALLDEIAATIRRHVVLPEHADTILATWVALTFTIDCFRTIPYMTVVSPAKGSGKTTLAAVLAGLVWRPLPTAGATTAALLRLSHLHGPTLLCDEGDQWLREAPREIIALLNAGNTKGTPVLRVEGEQLVPRAFKSYGAKAIFMNGRNLPSTLLDRSIVIVLRRRLPGERIEDLRLLNTEDLRRKLARWASDHRERLACLQPELPPWAINRPGDLWRPLFAVAQECGGAWPESILAAAEATHQAKDDEDDGLATLLLRDLVGALAEKGGRIASAELIETLTARPERPWVEFSHGKPITERAVARLLKRFEIVPRLVRFGSEVGRGYILDEHLADIASRYLGTESAAVGGGEIARALPPQKTPLSVTPPKKACENNVLEKEGCNTYKSVSVTPLRHLVACNGCEGGVTDEKNANVTPGIGDKGLFLKDVFSGCNGVTDNSGGMARAFSPAAIRPPGSGDQPETSEPGAAAAPRPQKGKGPVGDLAERLVWGALDLLDLYGSHTMALQPGPKGETILSAVAGVDITAEEAERALRTAGVTIRTVRLGNGWTGPGLIRSDILAAINRWALAEEAALLGTGG